MRCFIAIEIPDECRRELSYTQDKLRKVPGLQAKFVETENLHLTLKFLGEISDSEVARVKKALSSVKSSSFKAHFGKSGVFPSESSARVIWISLEPVDEVEDLAEKINDVLDQKDERFESHITLARVRNVANKALLKKALQDVKIEKKKFEIKNFKLMKSTLTAKGPIYEDVTSFTLD